MKLSDFDYDLPPDLIAQYPAARRDESRLVLLDRRKKELRETHFSNFPRYLREGDLLVINETKVIPARLYGHKRSGGRIEIFLTWRLGDGEWNAMLRPSRRLSPGEVLLVGEEHYPVTILEKTGRGEWRIALPRSIPEREFIERYGHVPLPPYIKRDDERSDAKRYQTVYARRGGSVAAPTAGLHFTDEILRIIGHKGITIMPLTLHVGPGTFRPLTREKVKENRLAPEYLLVRSDYWDEIREARAHHRRVVAVGTTTTRALESLTAGCVSDREGLNIEGAEYISGWTDLFIYPGFKFKVVDALLTNLHLPRSSLLLLVAAFMGREEMMRAYRWAVERRLRFYSYGDVMFIS